MNTAEVTLYNTSEIPMTYHLRVPSDGSSKESLQDADNSTKQPVSSIREFTIRPRSGTIPPDLSQDVQVSVYVSILYVCIRKLPMCVYMCNQKFKFTC